MEGIQRGKMVVLQVELMTKDRKFLMLPRLWWGWFGKRNNVNELEYRKNQQKLFRKNRIKWFKQLFQKFRKWILRN